MRHGTSKRRCAQSVFKVQSDVWVRDEKLDNNAVLAADGHMDWRSALGILHVTPEREHHECHKITSKRKYNMAK